MSYDFPNNPATGTMVVNATGCYYIWDGVKWAAVSSLPTGGGNLPAPPTDGRLYGMQGNPSVWQPVVAISDTAPGTPWVGEFWFDSVGAQLYVRYNDGNSVQWVIANGTQGAGAFLPMSGGTMTGPLTLYADASAPMMAVTLEQLPAPSNVLPLMNGVATIGTSTNYARQGHIHPSDTSRLATTGGNLTGNLTLGTNTGGANLIVNGPAGSVRGLQFKTGGLNRWEIMEDGSGETGSNAGSNLAIQRFDDTGALIGTPFTISRSGGGVTIAPTGATADPTLYITNTTTNGWPGIVCENDSTGGICYLYSTRGNNPRWELDLGNDTPETGGSSGCDFQLARYLDDTSGSPKGIAALTINRATGLVGMPGGVTLSAPATAPTPAVGNNTTSVATTAFVQTAAAPALNNTGRNLVHNGTFTVQQRGAGPWTTTGYTADRWNGVPVTDAVSFQIANLTDGDRTAIGDESARFAFLNTFTGSSTTNARNQVLQWIEGVRRLSGKTITISFWARVTSGAATWLGVQTQQNFGTGGSPSASVPQSIVNVTLTATWTRYSVSFAMPSTAGMTLGTNGDDRTAIQFWFSYQGIVVQSGAIAIYGVQLEIGSVATPLAKRDPADELALCQRFYYTSAFQLQSYGLAGNASSAFFPFPVTMRAAPTLTPTFTTQTNCGSSAVTAQGSTSVGYTAYQVYTVVTAAAGFNLVGSFTASADL